MNKIIITTGYVISITLLYLLFKNYSNIPSRFIIPILVILQAKYVLGNWDSGYKFMYIDIVYWISQLIISYLVVVYAKPVIKRNYYFKNYISLMI